jgi:hypothetical protein
MITALEICAAACKQANLDKPLTSLSEGQEFPYGIAKQLLNSVIQEINRKTNFSFAHASQTITVTTSQYNIELLGIDPKKIVQLVNTATGQALTQLSFKKLKLQANPASLLQTGPTHWAKQHTLLWFNTTPSTPQLLRIDYYKELALVVLDTDGTDFADFDSDILIEGVLAYLLQRLGRDDFQVVYQLYQEKLRTLLINQKQDAGLAMQMPANF